MNLKDLIVDSKSVWVEMDGVNGFEVEINYIPRTEMSALVKGCQKSEFNKNTRSVEMKLDEDKFIDKFVRKAINNWKGLTPKKLQEFIPVDFTEEQADTEVGFSHENAVMLIKESSLFDDWVNQKISDIDSFR